MEYHEAADIFPLMEGERFESLCNDIEAKGLIDDIVTHDGKVLDGRNRHRACIAVGVSPRFVEWDGSGGSPVAFVISVNRERRHLSQTQWAWVAAKAKPLFEKEAKERMRAGGGDRKSEDAKKSGMVQVPYPISSTSRDQAGKAFGVSGSLVQQASKVLKDGTPELQKAVSEGRLSARKAADISNLPPDAQDAAAKSATSQCRSKVTSGKATSENKSTADDRAREKSVALVKANHAIHVLGEIPRKDPLRMRAYQIVSDWIKTKQKE